MLISDDHDDHVPHFSSIVHLYFTSSFFNGLFRTAKITWMLLEEFAELKMQVEHL